MARPSATVIAVQGGLSNTSVSPSGTSLLLVSVPDGLTELGDYKGQSFGALSDVEAQGITPKFDTDNNVLVYEHIKDFYKNGNAVLYVLPVSESKTLTEILTQGDADYTKLDELVRQEQGKIKLISLALNPDSTAKTNKAGEASDIATAIPLAQSFRNKHADYVRFFNMFLEHRNFTATPTDAPDLSQKVAPQVSVVNTRSTERVKALTDAGITTASEYSAVGFIMGWVAGIGVEESIGKTRLGSIGWVSAEFSDGRKIATFSDNLLDALYAKRYIFAYRYPNKDSFYFGQDYTCAPDSDDYHRISRSRTMGKAQEIAYNVLFDEIEDDKLLDTATGELRTADRVELENRILNAITSEMMQTGTEEISGVIITIPTSQNILAIGKLKVIIQIQPKGITSYLTATVGYAVNL